MKQEGNVLSGKIGDGAKPSEMLAFTGKVDGDDVTIESKEEGKPHVTLSMTVDSVAMKGTGAFAVGDLKTKATIELKKD